jgi:hypothetical protein
MFKLLLNFKVNWYLLVKTQGLTIASENMPWKFYEIKPLIQNIGRRLKAGRAC